jgi:two-component system, cell cycle sensor histidine kinase and response regulator CckA
MYRERGETNSADLNGTRPRKKRTFRSRILLLGILAGFLPLVTIVFTVRIVSHSLQQEIVNSLTVLNEQEGKRLERQQHALVHSQIRQKALDVAEDVGRYLQEHPKKSLDALLQDPEFRAAAVQPVGLLGETFLLDQHTQKILLHDQPELESQDLAKISSLQGGKAPNIHLTGHTIYESDFSAQGENSLGHVVLAAVSASLPDGRRLMVGAYPYPDELAHVLNQARGILRTATNQTRLLLNMRLQQFQWHLILALALFSLAGFVTSLTLIRHLRRDVTSLTQAAEAYNAGNLDHRISDPETAELRQLAGTLNQMAANLQENTVSRYEWENTFDIIPDLIMVMDADQRLTRINRAAADYLGVAPEAAVGRPCRELLANMSEAQSGFAFLRDKSWQGQGREQFYWEDQGRTFFGVLSLLNSRDGKITGAVLAARDITVFKQTQRELAQTSHFLSQIIEAAPLALAVVNPQGLFTRVNPQVLAEYGYSPEELLDRHFSIVYADEAEMRRVIDKLRQRGEVINTQVELLHKDGHRVPSRLSIRKLYGEDGELLGSVTLSGNITEEISLQRQLEAAQKQEAIATLAGGLAHNFNNLLMVVVGLTTLMLSKITPDHPFYADLKEIERQVSGGREITRKLLSFRRGLGSETRPLDLNNLLGFTVDMFARTRRELTIAKDLAQNLPAAEVDPSQVQQVLMNLLINAWQAMPQGGEITVRTRLVNLDEWDDKNFQVQPGRYIQLSVTDTGEGMDEDTVSHLFEPFFTTKKPGHGSGLGLASAYRIIKNHRGAIRVHSERGKGATFDIYLPVSQAAPQVLAPRECQVITGHGTILVVDDEPLLRRVAGKLLEKLGYRVIEASSGQNALEIFQEKGTEIDLVLLDLIMPGLNGFQTLERLRVMNPEVAVLVCSGHGNGEDQQLPPGVNFLSKPYPLEILSQRVAETLQQRSA